MASEFPQNSNFWLIQFNSNFVPGSSQLQLLYTYNNQMSFPVVQLQLCSYLTKFSFGKMQQRNGVLECTIFMPQSNFLRTSVLE